MFSHKGQLLKAQKWEWGIKELKKSVMKLEEEGKGLLRHKIAEQHQGT